MRYLPAITAMVLVVASGIVHGFWTNRWMVSQATAEAARRLEGLPPTIGDWEGQTIPGDAKSKEAITGELYRRYVNRKNGSEVTVVIFAGLPGPVSIHTPDVCYGAAGFTVGSKSRYRQAAQGETPAAEFWTADLRKTRATEQFHQRIFWSWTSEGQWTAPDDPRDPRLPFAGKPVLFKIYLVRQMREQSEPMDGDPCIDLLHQLLPQLQKNLFDRND